MRHRFHRTLAGPVALAVLHALAFPALLAPAQAWAQDDGGMTFDEEEVETFGEPMEFGEEEVDPLGGDDWGSEDDWSEETPTEPVQPTVVDDGVITITGYIVPGDAIDAAQAQALTDTVMSNLATFNLYNVVVSDPLQTEFAMMGGDFPMTCSFDPVCLGRYARPLGIEKVVVGRVEVNDAGQWAVTIDLIDSGNSSIENYRLFTTTPDVAGVQGALEPQMRTLLGIRREQVEQDDRRRGPSPVQLGLAWGTLGLGVASLGVGVFFGTRATALEDELTDCSLVESADGVFVCDVTQTSARGTIDDGKSAATLANVFVGTGLLLAVGSVLLFTVTPGSDIDENADVSERPRERGIRNVRVAPSFDQRSVGLAGGFEF
jgi:hypothetical protein